MTCLLSFPFATFSGAAAELTDLSCLYSALVFVNKMYVVMRLNVSRLLFWNVIESSWKDYNIPNIHP